MIREVINILKPYKKKLILSVACAIIITIFTVTLPGLSENLIDSGVMKLDLKVTIYYVSVILILMLLEKVIDFIQSIIHLNLKNNLEISLQGQALSKLLRLKMDRFNDKGFKSIFGTLDYNVGQICEVVDRNFLMVVMSMLKMIGGFIGLMIINFRLTLFLLILIPFKYLITSKLSKYKEKIFNKYIKVVDKLGMWYGDVINGIEEIKLSNLYEIIEGQYCKLLNKRLNLDKKGNILEDIDQYSDSLIEGVILNLIYIVGVIMAIDAKVTIGGIISFTMYSSIVMEPIALLIDIKYRFANLGPAIKNYTDFMNLEGENLELNSYKNIDGIENIKFENVQLKYDEKVILDDINIEFKKGEKVALIGKNGSGKTSLINLLLRFYYPSEGNITINGVNINEFDVEKYREKFAVMSQNSYLFNTSIANNLDLKGHLSNEEIKEKCRDKNISLFIDFTNKMELGLDSIVGVKGSKVSGGERQKIGLIRTLLKEKSEILILDEATSNYDAQSEEMFNRMIEERDNYSLIFVISHRPEVLKLMDKVVVLDKGKVSSCCKYDQLNSYEKANLNIVET